MEDSSGLRAQGWDKISSGFRVEGSGGAPSPEPRAILHPSSQPPAKRVLVIGPSNIGDAILALDVIHRVSHAYPAAHLTLLVGQRARLLFAADPRIHTLVDLDAHDSWPSRLKLLVSLWRYQPHLIVDLRHTLYPLLLAPWRAWRYVLRPPKPMRHMRDRHLWELRQQAPLAAAGNGPTQPEALLPASSKDQAHVEALCRRWQLTDGQPLVVVCPGARSHIKRWTVEGFAQVADRLIHEQRAQVVFSGEPDEEEVIEAIRAAMPSKAHSAVGLITVRQLSVLMRHAQLAITNDSASLHMASICAVPTVAIFGPTDEAKYGPTSPQHRVMRRRLFCAPCEQSLCRFSHECMRFVSPEDVYRAAAELLAQGKVRGVRGEV